MNQNNSDLINDKYTEFWNQFSLFPVPWKNARFRDPRLAYLIVILTIIVFTYARTWLYTSSPDTWLEWIGKNIIGWLEPYLLFLGLWVAIWAYQKWRVNIPLTFEWLRKPICRLESKSGDFDANYLGYLKKYEQKLASKKHYLPIFFVFAILIMIPFGLYDMFPFIIEYPITLFFMLLWPYLIARTAWTWIVTMQFIKNLTDSFRIVIQPSHPDKCGGLKPLGDFCFRMALPLFISEVMLLVVGFSSLWLYLSGAGIRLYNFFGLTGSFDPFFIYISFIGLIVFTPLIIIVFFLPLWNIHRIMEAQKIETQDIFANRAASWEQQIRNQIEVPGGLAIAKDAKDKLEIYQAINPNTLGFPVWPFRITILIQLFSPQIITVIGFTISIYEIFS